MLVREQPVHVTYGVEIRPRPRISIILPKEGGEKQGRVNLQAARPGEEEWERERERERERESKAPEAYARL